MIILWEHVEHVNPMIQKGDEFKREDSTHSEKVASQRAEVLQAKAFWIR